LIHPTFYDHCSLVTLEALACGCPVITTAQNGAAELITHGREGLVIKDPREVAELSAAMCSLSECRTRAAMRTAALELAPQLDFRLHAGRVLQWLES
jgi:UDP-glucose:(heptosyl)LPS alpha-1,3-glucosyltransferase